MFILRQVKKLAIKYDTTILPNICSHVISGYILGRAARLYYSTSVSGCSFDPSTFSLFHPSETTPIQLTSTQELEQKKQEIFTGYIDIINELFPLEIEQRQLIEDEKSLEFDEIMDRRKATLETLPYVSLLYHIKKQTHETKGTLYQQHKQIFGLKNKILQANETTYFSLLGMQPKRRHIEKNWALYECSSIDPKDLVPGQTSICFLEDSDNYEKFKKIRDGIVGYFNQSKSWKDRIIYNTLVRLLLSRAEKKVQWKQDGVICHKNHARYTRIDEQGSVTVFEPQRAHALSWGKNLVENFFLVLQLYFKNAVQKLKAHIVVMTVVRFYTEETK